MREVPLVLLAFASSAEGAGLVFGSFARQSRLHAHRTVHVSLCELPLVGGLPIEEGDPVICRDEDSDAWWRATVRATRGSEILVHYMGCDDSWDAWVEADSPDVMRVDQQEAARPAFQSEEFEAELDDDELLDLYRQKQWEANARWQVATFAKTQLGSFKGWCSTYLPQTLPDGGPDGPGIKWKEQPATASSGSVRVETDGCVEYSDVLADSALAVDTTLTTQSFDRSRGTMTVGNAFTMARGDVASPEGLVVEVGVREKGERVRCKFLYRATAEKEVVCEQVAVVRETSVEAMPGEAEPVGTGLYDPPPGDMTRYCSLYCEGGLTVVFPARLPLEAKGFVSMDWTAGTMRYQADRKFPRLDGSLSTLELTEIQKQAASYFPPQFPGSEGGRQGSEL